MWKPTDFWVHLRPIIKHELHQPPLSGTVQACHSVSQLWISQLAALETSPGPPSGCRIRLTRWSTTARRLAAGLRRHSRSVPATTARLLQVGLTTHSDDSACTCSGACGMATLVAQERCS